jgi:hypothetical protein
VLAVALAVGAGLGMLGPAGAAAAAPAQIGPGCDVIDATLSWGFKESFRAYIQSDIANGEWTTSRGVTYETPEFTWSNGQGRYDPETGYGTVQFLGTVEFTGHGGLLDTTIADPTVNITSEGAFLVLDVSGPSMEGEQIDAQDVAFVELTGVDTTGEDARATLASDSVLTDDGEAAFPDYQAGTAFDPVTVDLKLDKCATYSGGYSPLPSGSSSASPLAIAGVVFGGLLLASAIVGLVLILRRRARA